MAQTLYSGPGKVQYSFAGTPYVFHAEGENGQVKLAINEKRTARQSASFGYHKSTLDDQNIDVSFTPFDSWALLPALFPKYLGVSTGNGANAGALAIGTRPHDIAAAAPNGNANSTVWTPDGRLYTIVRSAITQHPSMKLGVGQPLFEAMKITGLWDAGTAPGTSPDTSFLKFQGGPIADPDHAGFAPDFINGHWTATFGTFGTFEAEDFFTLSVNAKYSPLTVQKLTRHIKLDSVEVVLKGRLAGPTHDLLLAYVTNHKLGNSLGEAPAAAVTLNGPGGKTIIMNDAEPFLENQGFEFGGTKLGTGEVAFVSTLDFGGNPGAPQSVLIFSA